MSKIQIVSIQRPQKQQPTNPTPEQKSDRPKVKNQKPDRPSPGKKQPPKKLELADGSPMFGAIGIITGTLEVQAHKAFLTTDTGDRLKVSNIRDQRLLMWLLSNANAWQGNPLNWIVYPHHAGGFVLVGSVKGDRMDGLKPGQFRLRGRCNAREENTISVYIGRNDSRNKGFSIINVQGSIENLKDGSLCQLDCRLEGSKLILDRSELLMLPHMARLNHV